MSDLLHSQWRITDQAIANAVADETVILHLGNGTYYGLDPIGAKLWEALQAGERLEADLRDLVKDLAANELIEPA